MSDFIMDCEPEERMAQAKFTPVFEVDDINSNCSTITATETGGSRCDLIPTPSLLCKLRKFRIVIQRLPRHIVSKYKFDKNVTSSEPTVPSRTSKRLGGRDVPGRYLALHVNRPLKEVLYKKTKLSNQPKKSTVLKNTLKEKWLLQEKELLGISQLSKTVSKKKLNNTKWPKKSEYTATRLMYPSESSISINSQLQKRSEYLRASTRDTKLNQQTPLLNHPTVTKYSDVIITKYPMPQKSNASLEETINPRKALPCSKYMADNELSEPAVPSLSIKPKVGNQYAIEKFNKTQPRQCIGPYGELNSQFNQNNKKPERLKPVFPMGITPTALSKQGLHQSAINNITSDINFPTKATAMKTSNFLSTSQQRVIQNDAVIVASPKVLVINQPALRNDPLDLPGVQAKNKGVSGNEKSIGTDTESNIDSETGNEIHNTDKMIEPEVIKRIIYHSKSVQTKFTCNGSICGLVDSDEFNLNCFYCYDTFPLHKWLEFKEHIKLVHHVEEKEMESNEELPPTSPQMDTPNKRERITVCLSPSREKATHTNATTSLKNTSEKYITPIQYANTNDKATFNTNSNLYKSQSFKNSSDSFIDEIISLDGDDDAEFNDLIHSLSDEENNSSSASLKDAKLNHSTQSISDITRLLPPSLSHITIKKVSAGRNETENSPNQHTSKETFIKLPSNLNIQQVLKTIPKTSEQNANGCKKPRYFVVKKVLNPVANESKNKLNIPTNSVLNKVPSLKQCDNDDDDMPSNDEKEDPVPKSTNGCGILFGLTNRLVVIEFLLKLKTFPELWRPQVQRNSSVNYNESIKKLCDYMNNRFALGIEEFEMCLSIQRVKDWYYRILKDIHEHNAKHKNSDPYPHKFPLYFKILNQFLKSNIYYANNHILNSRCKSNTTMNNYPKLMVYKTDSTKPITNTSKVEEDKEKKREPTIFYKATYATTQSSIQYPSKTSTQASNRTSPQRSIQPSTQSNTPPTTPPTTPPIPELDDTTVIEFDADTLYGNESSDEEVLEEFDETRKECDITDFRLIRKRTKVYLGHYACDICNKVFKRKCDMERHKIHHFPPKYQCALCSKKYFFQHWAERCSHLRKSQGDKYSEKMDNSGTTIVEPLINVKPKWPKKIFRFRLICETCGASYRSIGSLNAHKRDKHLNQRLKCVVCNFTAITNYRIVQHQKKRHVVEPGTVEEVAKRSRARMDTKTPFSVEARQEFDWRREMRKKLKPGEKFYGCSKCRIIFQTRKEKVLHNKMEHPIKETTVICLLCLPEKILLSNSNSCRRHYTDIHKVPWDEIDALVKRTKPVFNFLTKEQIELLNASENYNELLTEMLKNTNFEDVKKEEITQENDEAAKAVQNLARDADGIDLLDIDGNKVDMETATEDNYIDGIMDQDYNNDLNEEECNEHNHSEDNTTSENDAAYYADHDNTNMYVNNHHHQHQEYIQEHDINVDVDGDDESDIRNFEYHIECRNEEEIQNDQQQTKNYEFVEGELVEECIVVEEECIDDVVDEYEYYSNKC